MGYALFTLMHQSLKISAGMLSGPGVLLFLRVLTACRISLKVGGRSRSDKVGCSGFHWLLRSTTHFAGLAGLLGL